MATPGATSGASSRVFALARWRRIALIARYLELTDGTMANVSGQYAGTWSREKLVDRIARLEE